MNRNEIKEICKFIGSILGGVGFFFAAYYLFYLLMGG